MSARTPLVTLTTLVISSADASGVLTEAHEFITEIPRDNSSINIPHVSNTVPLIKTDSSPKISSIPQSNHTIYIDEKFNKIERELSSYLKLAPDWDYNNGIVPESYSVKTSIDFLHLLKSFHLPLPKPMLANDGEVCIYWKKKDFYIEVGFDEDGVFSYAVDNHKTPFGEDNCNIIDFPKTKLYASLDNFKTLI